MISMLDLFAGCGGLTDGFLQTKKYKTLAAVDWEIPAVETLRNRLLKNWNYSNSEEIVVHYDLQKTTELVNGFNDEVYGESKGLDKIIGKNKVDVIVGGPPCQAYSIAGRVKDSKGMKDDYRNFLFESYVKLVDNYRPKCFIFENVEGILTASPGNISITKRIREAFENIGYEIAEDLREDALIDMSYYGIPQKRKRVIIFGVPSSKTSSKKISKFYTLLNSKKNNLPTQLGTLIDDLPKFEPKINGKPLASYKATEENNFTNHEPRSHSVRDIEIFKILTLDKKNGTNLYSSTDSLIKLYFEKTGKTSNFHKYYVLQKDKPSNTIPAHLHKDGLRHIHPDPLQRRSLTVREAARIQTFDDEFEFLGSRSDQYKMIGNAVPPKFSKLIAEVILELI